MNTDLHPAITALARAHDAWAAYCREHKVPPGPEIVFRNGKRYTFKQWLDGKGGVEAFAEPSG